jgi:predicted ATPase/Flp pilus assembly protein TadD
MINQARIKNFKTLADNIFELKNLNLFTGINGMGKSTFLQSLLMLRQSYIQNNMNSILINGEYTYLGSGIDVLFSGADPYDPIKFEIEYADKKYSISFNYQFKEDTEEENSASKDSDTMRIKDKSTLSPDFFKTSLFLTDNYFQYLNAERIGPRVQNDMNSISTRERKELGKNGEFALDYLSNYGHQTVTNEYVLHGSDAEKVLGWDNLENQVNAWLSDITPGTKLHTSRDAEAKKIKGSYSISGGISKYKPVNVGFGLTYALPVILALLTSKVGGTVIIENPESHLHPKGQSKMAELIARCAASGVQVFVETHSDHIINGIMVATYEHYKAKKHFYTEEKLARKRKWDTEIMLSPNNANAYNERGIANLDLGKFRNAIEDFDKAIQLDPKSYSALSYRAATNIELGKFEEAMADCNKAIEINGEYATAYFNRGLVNDKLDKSKEAMEDFTKVIKLDPTYSRAYLKRASAGLQYDDSGIIFQEVNEYQYSDALKDINKSIELNPQYMKSYILRGILKHNLRNFNEALQDLNYAIELDQNFFLSYAIRGAVYKDLEMLDEAIIDLSRAIQLNPKFSISYAQRAIVNKKLGKLEDADKDRNLERKVGLTFQGNFSESEVGISSEDVAIYFFSRKEGNNYSDVQRIKLKENGFIDGKEPSGFFDQFGIDMDRLMT